MKVPTLNLLKPKILASTKQKRKSWTVDKGFVIDEGNAFPETLPKNQYNNAERNKKNETNVNFCFTDIR